MLAHSRCDSPGDAVIRIGSGLVSMSAERSQDGQRDVEFVHDSGGFIPQLNITMKFIGKATGEACSKTALHWLLDYRAAFLGPCELEPRLGGELEQHGARMRKNIGGWHKYGYQRQTFPPKLAQQQSYQSGYASRATSKTADFPVTAS